MSLEFFKIELVIRKNKVDMISVPVHFLEIFNSYRAIENDSRLVVDLPITWEGFKDGTIVDLLKYFNESLYVGIAYFTDGNEIVTDFDGKSVDSYDETVSSTILKKYINKRLRIVKLLDKETDKFEIISYILDLKFVDPIIKVLSVYSIGKDSGVTLGTFNISLGGGDK
jgi:hypothetical protein